MSLFVTAVGLAGHPHASTAALARHLGLPESPAPPAINETTLRGADALAQLAQQAAHEAAAHAGLPGKVPAERVALLCNSGWGAIDSTVDYLESMLADEGRYASPRHFTRSIYSGMASQVAIALGIKGPTETLTFHGGPVTGLITRADILLKADRADAVLLCWADQHAPIAADLAKRSAEAFGMAEYQACADGPLEGAAAAMILQRTCEPNSPAVELSPTPSGLEGTDAPQIPGHVPSIQAVRLVAAALEARAGRAVRFEEKVLALPHAPARAWSFRPPVCG